MESDRLQIYVSRCIQKNMCLKAYRLYGSVKDHTRLQQGHRTRTFGAHKMIAKKKTKLKEGPNVKHCDTIGMTRYDCKSKLLVSCAARGTNNTGSRTITVELHHHKNHLPYYDVTLSSEAAILICENLEWSTPFQSLQRSGLYIHM